MAGKKNKSGGQRENAGRHKKEIERFKFQIMAYSDTIKAVKDFKQYCSDNKIDFVDMLNASIQSAIAEKMNGCPF